MDERERKQAELNDYITKVKEELGKREGRLLGLQKSISSLERELVEYTGAKSVRQGDAARTLTSAKYRNQLEIKLKSLRGEFSEVQREVNRARDRLRIAESELVEVKEL